MNDVLTIIADLIGTLVGAAALIIAPKVNSWILAKIGSEKKKELEIIVGKFVEAAEKTLKEGDKDGSARNTYVKEHLVELGYDITEEVNAYIESAVLNLN